MILLEALGRALGILLVVLVSLLIAYLGNAFILWDSNPFWWSDKQRAAMLLAAVVIAFTYYRIVLDDGEE